MKVVLTGSAGSLGTAVAQAWRSMRPEDELVPLDLDVIDLREAGAVSALFDRIRPAAVIHVAARVGGVSDRLAHPTNYLLDNILIDTSVIAAALRAGVRELLYVSSAGIYPADAAQPIPEHAILGGPLEPAMEPYAIAKIAGSRLCQYASAEHGVAYRAVVPSNLYGPGEDPSLERAQLATAALRKMYDARTIGAQEVVVWGDGTALRELSFVRDVAEFMVTQVGRLDDWPDIANLGSGVEVSIRQVYETAREVSGADVELRFDPTKPMGVPRRLLDSGVARGLGWTPQTDFADGMRECYVALEARLGGAQLLSR